MYINCTYIQNKGRQGGGDRNLSETQHRLFRIVSNGKVKILLTF